MSETIRESIVRWLVSYPALFERGGTPTRAMEIVDDGMGNRFQLNMSHPCTGVRGIRGVVVDRFDGTEVCERYTWKEIQSEVYRQRARDAYAEFKARLP